MFKLESLRPEITPLTDEHDFWYSEQEDKTESLKRYCEVDGKIKQYTTMGSKSICFTDYEYVGYGKFHHTEEKENGSGDGNSTSGNRTGPG